MRGEMKRSTWREIKDFGRMYGYVTNSSFRTVCQFGVNLESPAFERKKYLNDWKCFKMQLRIPFC